MRIDPINCKVRTYTTRKASQNRQCFVIVDGFEKGSNLHLIRWHDVCKYLGLNSGIIHSAINVQTYTIKVHRSNLGSIKFDPFFVGNSSTALMVSINGMVRMITKMLRDDRKVNRERAEDLRHGLIHRFPDEIVERYKAHTKQTTLKFKSKRQQLHDIQKEQIRLNKRIAVIMGDK